MTLLAPSATSSVTSSLLGLSATLLPIETLANLTYSWHLISWTESVLTNQLPVSLEVDPAMSDPLAASLSRKNTYRQCWRRVIQANKTTVIGNSPSSNTGCFDTSIKMCIQLIGAARRDKTWIGRFHTLLLHLLIQFCFVSPSQAPSVNILQVCRLVESNAEAPYQTSWFHSACMHFPDRTSCPPLHLGRSQTT